MIGLEKKKTYHYNGRENKYHQNQTISGQNRFIMKNMETIRIESDYNTNKTRFNITNNKRLRNC